MKIDFKEMMKTSKNKESYIMDSSPFVTTLFVIGALLYKYTNGMGTLICLVIALVVMIAKKVLITQVNGYFQDMYQAKVMFEKTKNQEYLTFIQMCSDKILAENKVLSEKGKKEIEALQYYVKLHKK